MTTGARLLRLLSLVRPHGGRFAVATLCLLAGSGLTLAYPQAARYGIDLALKGGSLRDLNRLAALLVASFVVHAIFVWLRHYLMSWLGERVVADLRRQVFRRLLLLPPSWFHERRTGELVGRLASDVSTVQSVVGSELSLMLRNVAQLLGGLVLLFLENARLTLLMLAVVPPLTVAVVVFGRYIRQKSKKLQDELASASGSVQESVGGIRTVQAFGREQYAADEYGRSVERSFAEALSLARWRASFFAAVAFATYVSVAGVVYVGGREVVAGGMSGGDLTAFLMYTTTVAIAVGSMAGIWGALMSAAGATERLYEIIDQESSVQEPIDPLALPGGTGAVRFDDVWFTYPGREEPALAGVTLDVRAGETLAIVGGSGGGKTTLTSLLLRFMDTDRGAVTLDGIDVRRLRLSDLRGAVAIVDQEPLLFSGSVAQNIAFGALDAEDAAIREAAAQARADEFIAELPQGYETLVGERGVKLSAGQKQRIAIARAILRKARVLVLDEATSNLDAESESLVHDALAQLARDHTVLVIAHRLSTVRGADRIVVLDGGKVAETGGHQELLDARGRYWQLVKHQVLVA
ncbi:MAG TPA: ABC transporter transmembrane domain-containing protein [Polyangiaceae bacterium]|nr:ABC transporter transmembrane domain-containing protein [Polyangiaceae bacterium]